MKGSLIVLLFFALGIGVGRLGVVSPSFDAQGSAMMVLYVLIALVGFEFGHRSLRPTLRTLRLSSLLLPLLTIAGTLTATLLAGLLLGVWSPADYLALGSGLGYYSLSSMLIIDELTAVRGATIATELAAIALLTNMMREIIALTGAPLWRRLGGVYGPVAAAGVTSLDVSLPVIVRICGQTMMPVAIIHGVVLEIAVPLLVILFCSI